MSDAYSEVVLAPTSRAKCRRSKLPIEAGELKLVSYYTPKGRSHMEGSSFKLTHVSPKTLQKIISDSQNGTVESLRGYDSLPEPAKDVAKRIIASLLEEKDILEADLEFRSVPEKKSKKRTLKDLRLYAHIA